MINQEHPATTPPRFSRLLHSVFILLPVISLGLMLIAWLKHGIDLPYRDDWREYLSGQIASLDLAHIFRSDNDTLSVTTRILDALAQRYLNGNSVAYQFLTMLLVLGAYLWLQWRLLIRATGNALIASSAFVTTLFMLQPDSYWGWQNLAYIQAVPLLAILGALYVALYAKCREPARAAFVFALILFAGITYISGAVASFAAGIVLLTVFTLRRKHAPDTFKAAIAFFLASLVSLAMQLWVIVGVQGGKTHRADAPWALPVDLDFWMYLLGKVGRSLMLPPEHPVIALVLVLAACFILVALTLLSLHAALRAQGTDALERIKALVILPTLFAAISAYLFIVAAGRTNLRPEHVQDPIAIFQYGYHRFHYFWVTVLLPWSMASIILLRNAPMHLPARRSWLAVTAIFLTIFAISNGALRHEKFFADVANRRQADLDCLRDSLMNKSSIRCSFAPYGDISKAYRYAVETHASFTRYFPLSLLAGNKGKSDPVEILTGSSDSISVRNVEVIRYTPGLLEMGAGRDPQIHFQIKQRQLLSECTSLRVSSRISPKIADTAQLFYQPIGSDSYSEANSSKATLIGARENLVDFVITSTVGFRNAFRLDSTAKSQDATVSGITVTCLL